MQVLHTEIIMGNSSTNSFSINKCNQRPDITLLNKTDLSLVLSTYVLQNLICSGSDMWLRHLVMWSPIWSRHCRRMLRTDLSSGPSRALSSCFRAFLTGRIFSLHWKKATNQPFSLQFILNFTAKQWKGMNCEHCCPHPLTVHHLWLHVIPIPSNCSSSVATRRPHPLKLFIICGYTSSKTPQTVHQLWIHALPIPSNSSSSVGTCPSPSPCNCSSSVGTCSPPPLKLFIICRYIPSNCSSVATRPPQPHKLFIICGYTPSPTPQTVHHLWLHALPNPSNCSSSVAPQPLKLFIRLHILPNPSNCAFHRSYLGKDLGIGVRLQSTLLCSNWDGCWRSCEVHGPICLLDKRKHTLNKHLINNSPFRTRCNLL